MYVPNGRYMFRNNRDPTCLDGSIILLDGSLFKYGVPKIGRVSPFAGREFGILDQSEISFPSKSLGWCLSEGSIKFRPLVILDKGKFWIGQKEVIERLEKDEDKIWLAKIIAEPGRYDSLRNGFGS